MFPQITFAIVWLVAYLIGAIPFGYLIARMRGVDILQMGSGNIGATNVSRILGRKFGIVVFFLDFAKGALPVLAALAAKRGSSDDMLRSGWLEVGAGLAAFLGHLYPVYLGFRGGKGIATGAGVSTMLFPLPVLIGALAWIAVVSATAYVSLASLVGTTVMVMLHLYSVEWNLGDPYSLFGLFAGSLVIVRHRSNIVRLMKGTENQVPPGGAMHQLGKIAHVISLGLWFGMVVFFTFVVGLSIFGNFESMAKETANRPAWFPLPDGFKKADANLDGPREQGSRAAGFAVSPLFGWYYLLQGLCGLVAAGTALGWSRRAGSVSDRSIPAIHKWRSNLLLLALATVLLGWPIERKVADLRVARNQTTEAYLASAAESQELLDAMRQARGEFGRWHFYSLMQNFATLALVSVCMGMAARLPAD